MQYCCNISADDVAGSPLGNLFHSSMDFYLITMRSYHNDSLTITISLKLKLPVLKVNKFKKKNLLVMPSSTMSCILQHDEIILELRRSTTRTYYFEKFKFSIFPCLMVLQSAIKLMFTSLWQVNHSLLCTYLPFVGRFDFANHILH